jgi:hypothetical protein
MQYEYNYIKVRGPYMVSAIWKGEQYTGSAKGKVEHEHKKFLLLVPQTIITVNPDIWHEDILPGIQSCLNIFILASCPHQHQIVPSSCSLSVADDCHEIMEGSKLEDDDTDD